jgi:hypothetical protein
VTLHADPRRRIGIPIVRRVGERSKRGFDVIPAPFVVQAALDGFGDECTPLARADSSIQLSDQFVLQRYVQTHVLRIAHSLCQESQACRDGAGGPLQRRGSQPFMSVVQLPIGQVAGQPDPSDRISNVGGRRRRIRGRGADGEINQDLDPNHGRYRTAELAESAHTATGRFADTPSLLGTVGGRAAGQMGWALTK